MSFSSAARGMTMLVTLVAVSFVVGACCKPPEAPAPAWTVQVSPVEDTNPTKTQHTFIATVYDQGGRPVPNVQVHWILARTGDAVGDIVTYDDQDLGGGTWKALTTKTDNQYAVSYTNEDVQTLHRGMRWVADEASWTDFQVGVGQTWCTITSPVEGTSHMIVYVPAIQDALCHKVFAVKHWQRVPHLVAMKQCPETALIGSEFEYRLTVTNDGEGATPGPVEVMESLPEGISIIDGTVFPQNLGVLNPGDSRTINFRVRADTAGTKVNRIEARAGEFVARADCTTIVTAYGIDIVKDCGGQYVVGNPVPFTITVRNTESATLTNVVVTDALPAGVEFVDASASAGSARCSDGRNVTWDGFELAAGGSATLTVNTKGIQIGNVQNVANVTANVAGGGMSVNDSDDCQCEIIGLPTLNIDKVCDPTQIGLGDPVNFRITVWNSGGADAVNVVVNDLVPAGLQATGETSWRIDRLPPSDQAGGRTFNIQAIATAAGTFTNVATVNADGATELRDSCDVTVIAPTLTIRKECKAVNPPVADDNTVLNRMDEAVHTITVQNGAVKAMDVVVVDRLPLNSAGGERLRYVSSNPAGTYDAGSHSITWNLGTLEANQTSTIEVTFQGVDIGPAVNTASVTARGFGGAQDDCRLFVLGSPAFQSACIDALAGNVDADNFKVDTPFYYVLAVQNEGEADLKIDLTFNMTGGIVLEPTPAGFIPDLRSSADPSGANVLAITDAGGGTFKMASFNLAPRETKYIKVPVRGTQVTTTDAAEITFNIDWQLWFEGRLFPRKGRTSEGESSVIDPK